MGTEAINSEQWDEQWGRRQLTRCIVRAQRTMGTEAINSVYRPGPQPAAGVPLAEPRQGD